MEIYVTKQGWVAMLVALLQRTPCVECAQLFGFALTHEV